MLDFLFLLEPVKYINWGLPSCQEKNNIVETFFDKKEWDENDWGVYLNNLDILRARHNLSKKQLNKAVNKWNLYRKDMGRPSEGTLLKICNVFNVTQLWLSTRHTKVKKEIREISGDYGVLPEPVERSLAGVKAIYSYGDPYLIQLIESAIYLARKTIQQDQVFQKIKDWDPSHINEDDSGGEAATE